MFIQCQLLYIQGLINYSFFTYYLCMRHVSYAVFPLPFTCPTSSTSASNFNQSFSRSNSSCMTSRQKPVSLFISSLTLVNLSFNSSALAASSFAFPSSPTALYSTFFTSHCATLTFSSLITAYRPRRSTAHSLTYVQSYSSFCSSKN